jgi:hypothetical protein
MDSKKFYSGERWVPLRRNGTGKVAGLILGGLVVGVMLFMMFVILGGLMNAEQ